ncbi:helix-turn-helix transcriptional regulator [Comamonas nitrativorans]|uniref:Helix-turn-helix transcriptional regulator n=1 Tax=Comamonas nitrativorans TaxID=108437 RepID=A0ABV9H216_9BURK
MDESQIQELRRARLADAIQKMCNGNVTAFGRLLGYSGGAYVRQMLLGNRAVSEKTVRHIEGLRGMHGWFSLTAMHDDMARGFDFGAGPDIYQFFPVELRLRPDAAGYTVWPDETDEDVPLSLHKHWLARRGYVPTSLLALRLRSGGMEPSLNIGDIFVINTAEVELRDGQVFVVNFYGELLVRRAQRDDGGWWLAADNLDQVRWPRKAFGGPQCVPIGRLVFKQSESI